MPEIQQPDIVGNYLGSLYQAQDRVQKQQDMQVQRQRADQQFQWDLDEHQLKQAMQRKDLIARAAMALDTPEKWNAAVPGIMQQLGMEGPPPSFDRRSAIIAEAQSVGEQLDQQWKAKQFGLQERVANANIRQSDASAEASRAQAEKLRAAKVGGLGANIDNQTFDNISSLRKEFIAGTKDYQSVRDAYGRIKASAQNPSAAGDLSLIFNYMKVLDPGSTVREGEFATAQNAAGIPERILNAYNNALKGERLNDNQRNDFVNRAGLLFKRQDETYRASKANYEKLAKDFGFDPSLVTLDQSAGLADEFSQPAAPQSFTGSGVFTNGMQTGGAQAPAAPKIPPLPPGFRAIP